MSFVFALLFSGTIYAQQISGNISDETKIKILSNVKLKNN